MPEYTRELTIELRAADDGARTAPAVLSTEFPVDRGGVLEVLSHAPDAVDLSRSPIPLLESHNSGALNIGVIENLHLAGRKLRGTVRLGTSQRARELWDDIKVKIVRSLSVGYEWLDHVRDGDTITVTRWRLLEASLIAIPADPGAGLFRSNFRDSEMETENQEGGQHQTRSQKRRESREAAQDLKRVSEINELRDHWQEQFPELNGTALRAVEENWPVDAFASVVRARIDANPPKAIPATRDYMGPQYDGGGNDPRHIIEVASADYGDTREVRDHRLRAFSTNRQTAEARAYVCGMWVRAAFFGDRRSERWLQDGGHLTRVMVESINVKGGATVPEELSSAVIALREEFGIARQFCQIMGMNSDTLVVPRRTGGVTAVYVGEEDAITASDAAWDNVTLNTRKLAALTRVSNDLIEDAVIDLATWLADEMARAFAEAEDDALWNGDGTSTYGGIVGVRPKLVDGTHTVGAVDATSGDDTFAEIIAGDLDTLMGTLPNYARKGAAWYCSQVCNQLVFQSIARAAGGVTMIETGGVIIPSYAGYPIRISEKMPTSTGSLDAVAMVLFGNLEMSAMLGDRRGFNVKVLEERYAEFDQVGVRATERYDIVVHDLGDTSAAGPIVGLIGNA